MSDYCELIVQPVIHKQEGDLQQIFTVSKLTNTLLAQHSHHCHHSNTTTTTAFETTAVAAAAAAAVVVVVVVVVAVVVVTVITISLYFLSLVIAD